MKTIKQQNTELNMRLAEKLGWTHLITIDATVLGRPPEGSPHSRDQAAVPNWAGDFNDCLKLALTKFWPRNVYPTSGEVALYITHARCDEERETPDVENAYRHIVIRHILKSFEPKTFSDYQ